MTTRGGAPRAFGAARGLWRRVARKPPRQLLQMVAMRLWDRSGADELLFPLHEADIWDSAKPMRVRAGADAAVRMRDDAPRIGWVVVPPTPGSGGHTTFFRMVAAAARAGYRCTVLFYDRYNGDFDVNVARLRQGWPWLDVDVDDIATADLAAFDAVVASAWPTAHVVAGRTADLDIARLYFLQDYEPDFFAMGSSHAFAEDSYRFPLTRVALGGAVAARLTESLGVDSLVVPYGTDRETYHLADEGVRRDGVAFFAKTHNDRRGYRMGILALRELRRIAPDVTIHVYGDAVREPGLRVHNHGYLQPGELNTLYNRVHAGLVLSFTNVSLIPAELAAAGAVPVMNDFAPARAVLDNPHAMWAAPTPLSLAQALAAAAAGDPGRARALAGWQTPTWDDTSRALLRILASRIGEPGLDAGLARTEGGDHVR